MRRIAIAAVLVAALVAVVVAVASSGSANTSGGDSITLYSGQHPETVAALVSAFEKQTGIKVAVRSDDEGVLAAQIIQEGSHSPADVFLTENSPPLEDLQEHGPARSRRCLDDSRRPPRSYSSAEKDWAAISARVSTIVYNTNDLKPSQLPKSVLDLASPKWKGKLAISPGETDFQPIVTAVAARYGQARAVKWLQGIRVQCEPAHLPRQRDARRPGEQRAG